NAKVVGGIGVGPGSCAWRGGVHPLAGEEALLAGMRHAAEEARPYVRAPSCLLGPSSLPFPLARPLPPHNRTQRGMLPPPLPCPVRARLTVVRMNSTRSSTPACGTSTVWYRHRAYHQATLAQTWMASRNV